MQPYDFAALKRNFEDKRYACCFLALKEVKSLLKQDPMQAALLAKIAWQAGNTRLERSLWRWGTYKYPDNVEMLCGLANAYQSAKRLVDAKSLLERAAQLVADDQERGKVWRQKCVLFSQMRLFTSAERCLQRAKETLGPDEVLNEEGYYLLLQERIPESAACFQKAILADSGRENTYPMMASLKTLEQDWVGAAQWLSAGLQQSPQSPQILYYFATIQWLLGENDAFEDSIAKIMELSPEAEFIPALNWLQGINAYRREDWSGAKETFSKSLAPGEKSFVPNLSTWNIDVPWDRVSLTLNPQIQRHNHCVPCAVSIILDYYGISVDQWEIGQGMMDAEGTPMHNLYTWLNAQGYSFVSFRANQEQVKTALRNRIPLLMSLRGAAGAHVTVINGFDDALQAFFLQDPGSPFPLPLPYLQYDEMFANSFYEAVAFVSAEEKYRLSVLQAWDEPRLRLLAHSIHLYAANDYSGAEEIVAQMVACQQGKIYYSQFLIDCRPPQVEEADFRLAVEQLWDAPQYLEFFRLRVINSLLGRGLLSEASDRMKTLRDRELGWYGTLLQARLALFHDEDLEKALAIARKAVRVYPESVESLAILGQVLMNQGEFSLAEEYFNWALELQPGRDWLYANLGENHLRQGQYAQAEECFKKALAMDSEDCWTLEHLGLCYLEQLQYDEAADCFRKVISLEPQRPWPYEYFSRINEMLGNFRGVINWLKHGLTVTEEHPELLGSLARILFERERYSEALTYLVKSMEKQDDLKVSALISSCLLETGRPEEAEETIETALGKQPNSPYLHAQCAHILERAGQEEKAFVHLEKAIELDPTYQWPLDQLLDLCKKGNTAKGKQVIEGILFKLGPSEDLLCYLGSLWEVEGEMEQAKVLYHQALGLESDGVFPRYRLAEIQRCEKRWTEAETSYTELLKSADPPPGVYFSLADLYRQTDRLAEAKTMLRQISGKFKDDPYYWNSLISFLDDAGIVQEFDSFLPLLPAGYLHSKLVHARYLEAVGQVNEAAVLLESYLAANSDDLKSLNEVAIHFERHAHLSEAEKKWAQSFRRDGTEKALAGLMRTLYNLDKLEDLQIHINDPRLTPKQKRDAYIGLAIWLYEDCRYHEASTWLNTDVVMENAEDYIYTYLAASLHRSRQGDEAIATISKAYSLFPDNINVIFWYGNILSDRGEWQSALQAYERLYECYSETEQKAYALAMQGYCLSWMGKPQSAQGKFRDALGLDSMEEIAASNLATDCLKQGLFSEALTILQPIIDSGGGINMPCLISNFLKAAFSIGLPGEQHWLDLAKQRLKDIRTYGNAGHMELKILETISKELAVELRDTEAQKEVGPKNWFAKQFTKYKVWRRFVPRNKLKWISIVCLLGFISLVAFEDVYLYTYIMPENTFLFAGCLLLSILTIFHAKWATKILAAIVTFTALISVLSLPVLQDLIIDKAYVEASVFALQTTLLAIASFTLLTLTSKTRNFKHLNPPY